MTEREPRKDAMALGASKGGSPLDESDASAGAGDAMDVSSLDASVPPAPPGSAPASGGSGGGATRVEDASSLPASGDDLGPGQMVLDRYRVTAKIGAGAMGEVYRAEDVKLGQEVALKFLPEVFSQDEDRLRRFINELKSARRVTHANVCRVHDIGEFHGRAFLTMEYVDGDDLGALLLRVGRLPEERALELARQLCAGLDAAHKAGVIHRDLKPGNVMIDSRGKLKILDFGLASAVEEVRGAEARAGTPAFMAPEQLAGDAVTVRSDLYGLGLVLYQMFTGRPAFKASSIGELRELQRRSAVPDPSSVIDTLNPMIDRAIARCLESNPERRPASAFEVAMMLPGGDPLAAAVAAGETPSPELVAAAGVGGGLRGVVAGGAVALMAMAIALVMWFLPAVSMIEMAPLTKSAPVLADDAAEMLKGLGYTDRPVDRAFAFDYYGAYVDEIRQHDDGDDRWERLRKPRPSAIDFWYRQSPGLIAARAPDQRVTMWDPDMITPGEIAVRLSPKGQLRELLVYARTDEQSETMWAAGSGASREIDVDALAAAADLDLASFERIEPQRLPSTAFDERRAWRGMYDESRDVIIRVEAAWLEGLPVAFRVIEDRWARASIAGPDPESVRGEIGIIVRASLLGSLLLISMAMARVHIKQRRGDRRGALILALAVSGLEFVSGLLTAHLPPDAASLAATITVLAGPAFMQGAVIWFFYIALEPAVRRLWPQTLITWSRALEGRLRCPLVSEHVLVGLLLGSVALLGETLMHEAWRVTGSPPPMPRIDLESVETLHGTGHAIGVLAGTPSQALLLVTPIMLGLVVLRIWFKLTWVAAAALALAQTAVWGATFGSFDAGVLVVAGLVSAATAFVAVRYGLLSLFVGALLFHVLTSIALTRELNWYMAMTVITLFAITAVALGAAGCAWRRKSHALAY